MKAIQKYGGGGGRNNVLRLSISACQNGRLNCGSQTIELAGLGIKQKALTLFFVFPSLPFIDNKAEQMVAHEAKDLFS